MFSDIMLHAPQPKADFMNNTTRFDLIETILWENNDFFLLDLHLKRLSNSARHFGFPCNLSMIERTLKNTAASYASSLQYKVKLLLKASGSMEIESMAILPEQKGIILKVTFSTQNTDKNDIFLKHKTTNRKIYDYEFEKYRKEGFFDVIFLNKGGEVTEGAITNIIIQKDDVYYTPPLECGLLPGTYRQFLLKNSETHLEEKVLFPEDLIEADKIFLINSVRKMVEVQLL